ncbi:hypothetical protein [Pseudomonas viridiflava]
MSFTEGGGVFGDTETTTSLFDRFTCHCGILETGNGVKRDESCIPL